MAGNTLAAVILRNQCGWIQFFVLKDRLGQRLLSLEELRQCGGQDQFGVLVDCQRTGQVQDMSTTNLLTDAEEQDAKGSSRLLVKGTIMVDFPFDGLPILWSLQHFRTGIQFQIKPETATGPGQQFQREIRGKLLPAGAGQPEGIFGVHILKGNSLGGGSLLQLDDRVRQMHLMLMFQRGGCLKEPPRGCRESRITLALPVPGERQVIAPGQHAGQSGDTGKPETINPARLHQPRQSPLQYSGMLKRLRPHLREPQELLHRQRCEEQSISDLGIAFCPLSS